MKNYVLITGATGGIGNELCKEFAKHQHNIALLGTNKEKLEKLAMELKNEYGIETYSIAKDISKVESCKEIYNEIKDQNITVDILCNNAGFGDFGDYLDLDLEKNIAMVKVNIEALMELSYYFGNDMKQKGYGKIMNTASTAAFQAGPLMATYYASKAFVLSFSESLSRELEGTGVSVMTLCPGPTNTAFFNRAGADESKSGLLKNLKSTVPDNVANYAYKQLMNNKVVAIEGLKNKLLVLLIHFIPRNIIRNIMYKFHKKSN